MSTQNRRHGTLACRIGFAVLLLSGCGQNDTRRVVTIWHQARPAERELLQQEIERFEAAHPQVRVRALYKETEELRSGFQAAALAGAGPELVHPLGWHRLSDLRDDRTRSRTGDGLLRPPGPRADRPKRGG